MPYKVIIIHVDFSFAKSNLPKSTFIVLSIFSFTGLTGDGTCASCDSGYIGANCDMSLVALLVPTIIGIILLAGCLYLLAQYFIAQ